MQPEDLERIKGLKNAADLLLNRLREKDHKKWLEVVLFSPPELLGNSARQSPDIDRLGRSIKELCDRGRLSLTMAPDGIVKARTAHPPHRPSF